MDLESLDQRIIEPCRASMGEVSKHGSQSVCLECMSMVVLLFDKAIRVAEQGGAGCEGHFTYVQEG